MNILILLGIMSLFIFGQKVRTNWVSGIKSTLTKLMIPGADRRLFSAFTASPIGWIRNAASWVRVFDWTGTAAGINGLGGVGGGTLITRRHVLFAQHVPYRTLPQPFDIFFSNAVSRTFQYKVTNIQQVGDTDIAIGTLDRDADSSLTVYRTLPDNWLQYIKGPLSASSPLPVLYGNQDKKVATGDLTSVSGGVGSVTAPTFEVAKSFSEGLRVGDSGNPIFTMIGDELVLLGGWWKSGSYGSEIGSFPWLIAYRGAVEKVIGQKLLVADMSGLDKV